MALKFLSNSEALTDVFDKKITQKEITNWAIAGVLRGMNGEDGKQQSFPDLVRKRYLENGYALGVREEDFAWQRDRGWHHYETFMLYRPKRRRRNESEFHAGMYSMGIRKAGKQPDPKHVGSLNYINSSLKQKGYIRSAWNAYKGVQKTKDELEWMFVHGIEKKAREAEEKVK